MAQQGKLPMMSHAIKVPVQVPATPLPIQLPANTAMEDGLKPWATAPEWTTPTAFWAPGSVWASPRCRGCLASELPDRRFLPVSTFQIRKNIKLLKPTHKAAETNPHSWPKLPRQPGQACSPLEAVGLADGGVARTAALHQDSFLAVRKEDQRACQQGPARPPALITGMC